MKWGAKTLCLFKLTKDDPLGTKVFFPPINHTSVSAQLTLRLTHPMPSLAQSKLTATSLAQGEKV